MIELLFSFLAFNQLNNYMLLVTLNVGLLVEDNNTSNPHEVLPWVDHIRWANIDTINICFFGVAKASMISLQIWSPKVCYPRKRCTRQSTPFTCLEPLFVFQYGQPGFHLCLFPVVWATHLLWSLLPLPWLTLSSNCILVLLCVTC